MGDIPALSRQWLEKRGVAQSGSAVALGAIGRGFESLHPDQFGRAQHKVSCFIVKREVVFDLSLLVLCGSCSNCLKINDGGRECKSKQ